MTTRIAGTAAAVACLLLLVAPAGADDTYNWSTTVGNGTFNAGVDLEAGYWDQPSKMGVHGEVAGRITALGIPREVARIEAESYNTPTGGHSELSLVFNGRTVFSRTFDRSWSYRNSWSRQVVNGRTTFAIGPVPVTLAAAVSGSLDIDTGANLSGTGGGFRLVGNASAQGRGSADAGVRWANVRGQIVLDLFNLGPRIESVASVTGFRGFARVDADRIKLLVEMSVHAIWPLWRRTLVDKDLRGFSWTIFQR